MYIWVKCISIIFVRLEHSPNRNMIYIFSASILGRLGLESPVYPNTRHPRQPSTIIHETPHMIRPLVAAVIKSEITFMFRMFIKYWHMVRDLLCKMLKLVLPGQEVVTHELQCMLSWFYYSKTCLYIWSQQENWLLYISRLCDLHTIFHYPVVTISICMYIIYRDIYLNTEICGMACLSLNITI